MCRSFTVGNDREWVQAGEGIVSKQGFSYVTAVLGGYRLECERRELETKMSLANACAAGKRTVQLGNVVNVKCLIPG